MCVGPNCHEDREDAQEELKFTTSTQKKMQEVVRLSNDRVLMCGVREVVENRGAAITERKRTSGIRRIKAV